MNPIRSHLEEIDMIGKLADLKDSHYRHTLLLHAFIELLDEKKVISKTEISDKMKQMDRCGRPDS